jgi:DNA-binding NarL/FixJ family response regulator
MPIRIALGEDASIVREGVRQLLAVEPEVEIGAAVADHPSLRQACDEEHPEVVLSDVRIPPTHTDEVAAQRRRSTKRSSCSRAARSRRPSSTQSRPRRSRGAQRS